MYKSTRSHIFDVFFFFKYLITLSLSDLFIYECCSYYRDVSVNQMNCSVIDGPCFFVFIWFQVRRICKTSGAKISFDTANACYSFYRASVDFVLHACSEYDFFVFLLFWTLLVLSFKVLVINCFYFALSLFDLICLLYICIYIFWNGVNFWTSAVWHASLPLFKLMVRRSDNSLLGLQMTLDLIKLGQRKLCVQLLQRVHVHDFYRLG